MGMNRPRNEQMKPILMAMGAAAAAAIAAMMVPVSLIEAITGATGLSELIPATAAPLGAKARAIIAFFAGAVTLMMAMGYLMRRNPEGHMETNTMQNTARESNIGGDNVSLLSKLQARMSGLKASNIQMPSMPWAKKYDDDILDLADLPHLREQDAHPDAPSRRPISALTDLADASLTNRPAPLPSPSLASAEPKAPTPVTTSLFEQAVAQAAPELPLPEPAKEPVTSYTPPAPVISGTTPGDMEKQPLAHLLAQLETAIEGRLKQLSKLEALSAEVQAAEAQAVKSMLPAQAPETIAPAPVMSRPPLEAVSTPARAAEEDGMDAALNAALETLQRMNVQAR
jgi:hypothetical protein